MASGRRGSNHYQQTFIGDCGHLCGWPQVGNNVFCDVCEAEKLGAGVSREDAVTMVRIRYSRPQATLDGFKPKPKKRTPRKPPQPTCSVCRKKGHLYMDCPLLVGQQKLFEDG